MTQLAFDFDALGIEPDPDAADLACIPERGDIHVVASCGHCAHCGKPMFQQILMELAHKCQGHEVAA
ncbi:hypothetical protein [Glaciibacter psychrotolerans]|uniref:Uncharacterized protein n=1 Tax=Glaciibacter psychrotolerans TaxID=670054 RepID=A0A7Z0ECP1_9MICO|nr:hypothetical protein [Leifsonia psychrotolerans]NYJ19170.1 hypothetical protein [Leifsonia psychrotolerans]